MDWLQSLSGRKRIAVKAKGEKGRIAIMAPGGIISFFTISIKSVPWFGSFKYIRVNPKDAADLAKFIQDELEETNPDIFNDYWGSRGPDFLTLPLEAAGG